VDVPLEQVVEAYQLFAHWCPMWAAHLKQRHVYLKYTTRGSTWVTRFSPSLSHRSDN
jgi:hypothetical protein